jgi:hypothetical protein
MSKTIIGNAAPSSKLSARDEPGWKRKLKFELELANNHAEVPTIAPDEFVSQGSYVRRLERKRAWMVLFWENRSDWFISINTNDSSFSQERLRRALRGFGALVDQGFLGSKHWSRLPADQRAD